MPNLRHFNANSILIVWINPVALAIALTSCIPVVRGGDTTDADAGTVQRRYKSIVEMSEVERDRLKRNVAEFAKLSPEKRDYYRELHQQVEADSSLAVLMDTYSAWLQTLTPAQRDELWNEKDSAKKLALVRKFKEEQYHRTDVFAEVVTDTESPGSSGQRKLLPNSELNNLIKVIMGELTTDDHDRIGKPSSSDQYLEVLERSIRQSPGGASAWPSRPLQEKLMASFSKNEIRNFIKSHKSRERDVLCAIIFRGVLNHAWDEVKARLPKDDPDLSQVYSKLTADEKSRIDLLHREGKRRELARRYCEAHGDNSFRHFAEMRGSLSHLLSQLELSRPWSDEFTAPQRLRNRGGERGNTSGGSSRNP